MKVFIATLGTETNTFAPIPTGLRGFEDTLLLRGTGSRETPTLFSEALHVWRRRAEARGWDVIESIAVFAQPAGLTVRSVYEGFRDEILADLKAAGGADIILIQMHGAMVADGYDDCEGDLMHHLRDAAPDAVLGLELDPHCHVTDEMIDACDLIVCFKEYPHIDATPRAEELFTLAADTAEGKIRPVIRDFDCRMINTYMTMVEPMRSFVDTYSAAEGKDGILSLSLAHGFPWADVERVGTRMLAIADGDADRAQAAAEQWGRAFIAQRHEICKPFPDLDAALDRAEAANAHPVVLADMADNAGGGAPSDATFLLRALLDRGLTNVVTGIYWDPIVVGLLTDAGIGATLDIRLGGKMGPMSGDPVDLSVTVRNIGHDMRQTFGGSSMPLGTVVWVTAQGLDIFINDTRSQTFHPDAFTQLGITLADKAMVCVKSSNHFYAGFEPIASEVIQVATPGAITPDFANIPFTKRDTRYWPRVEDPWS
jgi:microcystin degradation protein MlrC